ncbi:hypothetical protein PSA7680_02011 [Pseudoruegeria aquimaris]|uniref:Periplasmic folding chaperone n=1 Tax=Pseudoruegeria aquimaris TaxID=393663 RepID=A0A1Y5SL71_9RHOB|nr:hypothetical protein PSA7680_02011 [Pseudoruegeria aquimaris]
MIKHVLTLCVAIAALVASLVAAPAQPATIETILAEHEAIIAKGSRKTIEPAIDALKTSGLPEAQAILEKWQAKELWQRKADKRFFTAEKQEDGSYRLFDPTTGAEAGSAEKKALKQIKPNAGVRGLIGAALVQFQLMDPDPERRRAALTAIERDPEASHLAALRGAIDGETDPAIKAHKQTLERLLTIRFGASEAERVAAIESFAGDLSVGARAALNPILATRRIASATPVEGNIAATLTPGSAALPEAEAYALLVSEGLAPAAPTREEIRAALAENITEGRVAGVPVARLDTDEARAPTPASPRRASCPRSSPRPTRPKRSQGTAFTTSTKSPPPPSRGPPRKPSPASTQGSE